jgi:hypothetical protein
MTAHDVLSCKLLQEPVHRRLGARLRRKSGDPDRVLLYPSPRPEQREGAMYRTGRLTLIRHFGRFAVQRSRTPYSRDERLHFACGVEAGRLDHDLGGTGLGHGGHGLSDRVGRAGQGD